MKKLRVEVCMISARGLNRPSSLWKLQWYAVGWIDPNNKYCTKVDASGSKNPTWKTKFSALIADDNEGYESKSPTLNIQVFSREPIFLREKLQGTATILLREFVDKYYSTGNMNNSSSGLVEEVGSFQLRKKTSGKPQGLVDVSIRMSADGDDAGGGDFPGYHYSGNNGEGFELGGADRGGNQVNEIFIGGGRWSNVEDQRLRHHHHQHQSGPDSHPQLRSTAQGRRSDMEDYPLDPHQPPGYSNSQQDYPHDPHQPPEHSHSRQHSAFHGGGSNARHNHPHTNTQPKDHSQSQLHPETQGRWSNAEDDTHISQQPLDHSQQRSPSQGRWSNVRRRHHPLGNNQQMDTPSQLQPETQGGWSDVEDHHHSSQQQPDQFHSQSRTAVPPNWRQQPKGTYPDSQSMMQDNNSNQQSFTVQSTQSSYRPPPPPPPPPSHVGFLPSFLPTADPRFSSAYADNRRPGGGTAPAGHSAGSRNNSGAAMGVSAGALAAGAVLFGDDFISGFDIPANMQEETHYYY